MFLKAGVSALALAATNGISHVIADPVPKGCDDFKRLDSGIAYFRLHGSPRMYFSPYTTKSLSELAVRIGDIAARNVPVWCIFDNTGSGAAAANALTLQEKLAVETPGVRRKASKK